MVFLAVFPTKQGKEDQGSFGPWSIAMQKLMAFHSTSSMRALAHTAPSLPAKCQVQASPHAALLSDLSCQAKNR